MNFQVIYFLQRLFSSGGVLIVWGISLVCYVLLALGLWKIARKRGIRNPWLAWIPVANVWLEGSIADAYHKRFEGRKTHYALLMTVFTVAAGILLVAAPVLGMLAAVLADATVYTDPIGLGWAALGVFVAAYAVNAALFVFTVLAYYKIYHWCSEKSVCMTVLTAVLPECAVFFVFFIRNRENPRLKEAPPAANTAK